MGRLRNVVVGWVRYDEVLMFYIIKGLAGSEHAADALQNGVLRGVVRMLLGGDLEDGGDCGVKPADSRADAVGNLRWDCTGGGGRTREG